MHMHEEQSVGGIFDFLSNAVTSATKLSTNIVQGKIAFDATKAAWKGIPYIAPQIPGVTIPYAAAGGTDQRFIPGTTQIAAPVVERPLTKAEIAEVQQSLNAMGYNTGKVDGLFGPNTAAGVRAFQSAYGLTPTGQLSMALLQQVRGGGSVATQPITAFTPPQNQILPFYSPAPPSQGAPVKTTEEKLWTWVIPGVAALGGLLLIMSQNKGRR